MMEPSDAYAPIDFGAYTQPVSTGSAAAQLWFNRGCVWAMGFHREEAAHCFARASEIDPECAMAWWGLALANGPDYNFHAAAGFYTVASQPKGYPSLNVATDALERARALPCAPRERALISALSTRYEWPVTESTVDLQEKYAAEMEAVASAFPDDADIQAVCAEALLCLSPWDLYTRPEGAKPAPNWSSVGKVPNAVGVRVVAALDRGLRAAPAHPWLAHLKVHYCEMGPVGAFDWSAADALRAEGSGRVGHLLHMPTHLDIQDGRYDEAVSLNVAAYEADLRMHAFAPERFGIYAGYAVHNMEFCAWAAMYAGRRAVALEAARQIDNFLDEKMLRRGQPTMATFFEARRRPPAQGSLGGFMPAIHQ